MKVYLVDDNDDFRSSLKLFLEGHLNIDVAGETSDGLNFVNDPPVDVDLVLMDINMPLLNGLQATKQSTWSNRSLKIIAVSQYVDTVDLKELISVGFKGFVSKTNLFRDLEPAIEKVLGGGYFFPPDMNLSKP